MTYTLIPTAELAKVREALTYLTSRFPLLEHEKNTAALAIIDTKAKPVEVVGWRNNINYCVQFKSDEMTPQVVAGYMTPQWTWLYAIKETP